MGELKSSDSPALLVSRSPALLFDAVGTLIYAEPRPAVAYETVGRRHGSRLSLDEIESRFRRAFAAEEVIDRKQLRCVTDEARERRRWQAIVATVLDDVTDQSSAFAELWDHFASPKSWRAFADAVDAIQRLVEQGRTIGVASNFDARLQPVIAALFPAIPIDRIFASSQLGHRKPSREFFAACAAKLPQSQSFALIGDDVDNDYHGARNAGWTSIFLDRDKRHAELTPRLTDLADPGGLAAAALL